MFGHVTSTFAKKRIALLFLGGYALFGLLLYVLFDLALLDYLVYIVVLVILILSTKKLTLPNLTIILWGCSVIPHSLGMIPFYVDGQEVSLYHSLFFGGYYDIITHTIGMFLFSLGLLYFYTCNTSKITWLQYGLVFLALLGVGTIVEICEFLGYSLFGFGWGAFAFGEGDNSENFGPWGDSMTDTFANLTGITLGFLVYFLFFPKKKSWFRLWS